MVNELKRIAELQLSYSSTNTPAMQERGRIITKDFPKLLNEHLNELKPHLGKFGGDLAIEGSDGIGRKTEAPWVRYQAYFFFEVTSVTPSSGGIKKLRPSRL